MNASESKPAEGRYFDLLFQQLTVSLSEAAMMHLGKLVNPTSGKSERNLPQARATIDMLRMLQAKAQGNLGEAEEHLLTNSLTTLQLNYAAEVKAAEAEKSDKSDASKASDTSEASKASDTSEASEASDASDTSDTSDTSDKSDA